MLVPTRSGGGGHIYHSSAILDSLTGGSWSTFPCVDSFTGQVFTPKYCSYAYIYGSKVMNYIVDFVNGNVFRQYNTLREDITSSWYGSDKYTYADGNNVKIKGYAGHGNVSIDLYIYD